MDESTTIITNQSTVETTIPIVEGESAVTNPVVPTEAKSGSVDNNVDKCVCHTTGVNFDVSVCEHCCDAVRRAIEVKESVENRQPDGTFGPGNVANPLGRPKKWTMQKLLLELGEEKIEIKNKFGVVTGRKMFKELVAKKLWQIAIQGDLGAIKEIFDRIDGKVPQKNEMGGYDGDTIHIDIDKYVKNV